MRCFLQTRLYASLMLKYILRCDFLHRELIVWTDQVFRSAHWPLQTAAAPFAFSFLRVFPMDIIVLPHVCMYV